MKINQKIIIAGASFVAGFICGLVADRLIQKNKKPQVMWVYSNKNAEPSEEKPAEEKTESEPEIVNEEDSTMGLQLVMPDDVIDDDYDQIDCTRCEDDVILDVDDEPLDKDEQDAILAWFAAHPHIGFANGHMTIDLKNDDACKYYFIHPSGLTSKEIMEENYYSFLNEYSGIDDE